MTETPSIFIPGKYGSSATISRSFYLAIIYYCLLNVHPYFPYTVQADPAVARAFICVLQVLHFVISYIFSIDIFQIISVFLVHRVVGISVLVGDSNKKVVQKHVEVKKVVKEVVNDVKKVEATQSKKKR